MLTYLYTIADRVSGAEESLACNGKHLADESCEDVPMGDCAPSPPNTRPTPQSKNDLSGLKMHVRQVYSETTGITMISDVIDPELEQFVFASVAFAEPVVVEPWGDQSA